jgi:hypothetical protein|tara:strand:- start:58 stop:585 length:528 start_codon:yes stop_codon:yes gene_type:complete
VNKTFCRENLEIEIHHHPHHQSLNEKLMHDFSKLNFFSHNKFTNIKGSQFNFVRHQLSMKPKGVTLVENWAKQIIQNKLMFPVEFRLTSWATRLDRGQETLEHDHLYYATFAFVYFVNTPKGASPLVFPTSGKKVKAESGKLILFPAPLRHKVPVNKCDNRVTIASNITIIEKTM